MKHSIFAWSAVALLASSSLVGCVVNEDSNVNNRDGGVAGKGSGGNGATGGSGGSSTAGTGGSTGGTGATAGSGGTTGGTGGATTGGTGGTTGGAGGTGGVACFDDTATTTVDCANLPYASTMCDDNGNTVPAYGNDVCAYSVQYGRNGVTEAVYNCLANIGGDACSAAHDDAANNCYLDNFGNACPSTQPDGGTCADIGSACPGALDTCNALFDGYTSDTQLQIAYCFSQGTGECAADFQLCLANPLEYGAIPAN